MKRRMSKAKHQAPGSGAVVWQTCSVGSIEGTAINGAVQAVVAFPETWRTQFLGISSTGARVLLATFSDNVDYEPLGNGSAFYDAWFVRLVDSAGELISQRDCEVVG